jgi:hypothetical protein
VSARIIMWKLMIFCRDASLGWAAVARGAVLKGIELDSTSARSLSPSPRHYGFSTSQPFLARKHSEEDAYFDPFDGGRKARDQMTWLVRKGDVLISDKPKEVTVQFIRRFGVVDPRVFRTTFLACDEESVADRYRRVPRSKYTYYSVDAVRTNASWRRCLYNNRTDL